MKFNKINIILSSSLMIILMVGCNNADVGKNEDTSDNIEYVTREDLNPIDKKHVIKILQAEFGDELSVSEDEISIDGDYYVVEAFVEIMDYELHDGYTEPHIHRNSMGIYRIDMYTGEIQE